MYLQLYNNLGTIFQNYWSILKCYKTEIISITILLCLAIIYTIFNLIEYRLSNITPNANSQAADPVNREPFFSTEKPVPNNQLDTIKFLQPGTRPYEDLIAYWKSYYFPKFNQPNIQARGFSTINQLTSKYINSACEQMTEDDQDRIHALIASVFLKLKNSQSGVERLNVMITECLQKAYFVKGRVWLEAGMPHTHGRAVIMPESWTNNPTESTFIHELAHIHQRFWPDKYTMLYSMWGFQRSGGIIKGLEQKVGMYRLNPDGLDMDWIWREPKSGQLYWIASLFTSLDPETIRDVEYLAFSVSPGMVYTGSAPRPLATFTEFQEYFNINNNHYHPNEIAAQYFEYYLDNVANGTSEKTCPGYEVFKQWIA